MLRHGVEGDVVDEGDDRVREAPIGMTSTPIKVDPSSAYGESPPGQKNEAPGAVAPDAEPSSALS